jgi:hypothetical protein
VIDYRAHALAFENVRQALASASFGDPNLDVARDETLADVAKAEDYALLGAFVDHLMAHAASDGKELALLGRAAELWEDGVALYGALGAVRAELEAALETPSDPAAAARFNNAAMEAQRFAQRLHGLQARIFLLRDDIDPLPHLPPHPRQEDRTADSWDWGNFLLARRTDAFVRTLMARASDPATRAFAFGALTSYAANVSGSSYLGHVVGGARRAHRFRDRVARNSVGTWLKRQHPSIPSLTEMAQRIGFGNPAGATLPPEVATLIEDAVSGTFDASRAPPLPDLGLGYRRLVTHLELLDRFVMPPIPAMPSPHFTAVLFANPAIPPPTLRPQTVGVTGDTSGGVSVGSNTPGSGEVGKDDSKKAGGALCVAVIALIILFVILLVVTLIKCIIEWADGKKCNYFEELGDTIKDLFEEDPPHPSDPPTTEDPDMTAQGLTAFAATEQAAQLVGHLWDVQQQMWEGLDQAYGFLAKTGLIYPDSLVENPGYKQFTSTPAVASNKWPHRPEADPEAAYHLYPNTPLEEPVETPSPFSFGASPNAFAVEAYVQQSPTAARFALPLWRQIARGEQDSTNYDLDADRGNNHPCWATGGSIDDNPVDVVVLGYEDQ